MVWVRQLVDKHVTMSAQGLDVQMHAMDDIPGCTSYRGRQTDDGEGTNLI